MSSKTKIVVLRMKEIIYTAIFAGLAILLITLCFIMFRHGDENTSETDAAKAQQTAYVPGVYSTSLTLGNEQVNVEVTVDKDQIRAVTLVFTICSARPSIVGCIRGYMVATASLRGTRVTARI